MKLQRIRYFVTLADTLSFSRTAEIHYVSQLLSEPMAQALDPRLGLAAVPLADETVALVACTRAEDERPQVEAFLQFAEQARLR